MGFKNLLRILSRRWGWIFVSVPLFAAYYYAFPLSEPVRYAATSRLVIQVPRSIDALRTGPASGNRLFLTAGDINTLIATVRGKRVRQAAERRLGRAIALPYGSILVEAAESANFIDLTATAGAAGDAEKIVAEYAAAAIEDSRFQAEDLLNRAIESINVRIAENEKGAKDDRGVIIAGAESARREIQALQDKHNTIDLEKLFSDVRARIVSLQAQKEDKETLKERKQRELVDHSKRKSVGQHGIFEAVPATRHPERPSRRVHSPVLESLHGQLVTLRLQLEEMKERWTPGHPEVLRAQARIRETEARFLSELRIETGISYEEREWDLRGEIALIETEIQALDRIRAEKETQLDGLKGDYNDYVEARNVLAALQQETRSLRDIQNRIRIEKSAAVGFLQLQEQAESASELPRRYQGSIVLVGLLCLFGGVGLAYLFDFFDTTIRTDYDIRRHLNLTVTGIVPFTRTDLLLPNVATTAEYSIRYDRMATLVVMSAEGPGKAILVTSPKAGDGKTTLSINLATAIARQGRRVIVVDGDLRRPTLHKELGIGNQQGFQELLAGLGEAAEAAPDENARVAVIAAQDALVDGILQPTQVPNLFAVTSGTSEDPLPILTPERIARAVAALKRKSDFIVFDSSPVLLTSEPLKLAGSCDMSYLVISTGETNHTEATSAKQLLKNVGADLAGVFLNKAPRHLMPETYYYYYDNYAYGGRRTHRK